MKYFVNMKRIIYMIAGLALASACSEIPQPDYEGLFPEEYHKVLYFKDSGKEEMNVFVNSECIRSFTVCKAGSEPSLTASCSVEVMDQTKVDAEYNEPEGENYVVLPQSAYQVSVKDMSFASGETWKTGKVTFYPSELKTLFDSKADDEILVLPLEITSDEQGTVVNNEKNVVFYKIMSITELELGFTKSKMSLVLDGNIEFVDVQAKLKGTDEVPWDVTCNVSYAADAQQLLEEFNQATGMQYELLPESMVTYPSEGLFYEGGSSTSSDKLEIGISASEADASKFYLLPLRLTDCSKSEIILGEPLYILIASPLDYQADGISLRAEMFSSPHSQRLGEQYLNHQGAYTTSKNICGQTNNDFANLLDGDPSTLWSTWRQYVGEPSAKTWPSVDPEIKEAPGYWFDVKLDEPVVMFSFGYSTVKRQHETDLSCPRGIHIEVNGGGYDGWTEAVYLDEAAGLPLVSSAESNGSYLSESIIMDKPFTEVRFRVTKVKYDIKNGVVRLCTPGCFDGNEDPWFSQFVATSGRLTYNMGYFAISEFELYGK